MKILIALFLCVSIHCAGQQYYCPASNLNGVTVKVETWLLMGDSIVTMKSKYKERSDSVSYIRIKSTNPAVMYYTDGVMTTTVTKIEKAGTVKGYKYSQVLMLQPDSRAPAAGTTLMYYCTIIPNK
jgi:hypothetical protein